jgi:hypothetical protein
LPTKRVKRQPDRIGISAEAAEAWRVGDWHAVNRLLDIAPNETSPFTVTSAQPPDWMARQPWRINFWKRAWALRQALRETGPPGRHDRHGAPLGPARPGSRSAGRDD